MPTNFYQTAASLTNPVYNERSAAAGWAPAQGIWESSGGYNPDPFLRGINARTAFDVRKNTKRLYAPAAAALAAQDQLLDPTLALTGRAAAGYGDIYRGEADKSLQWALGHLDELDPETSELLKLLQADATGLIRGGSNPYEDQELSQTIRGAQSARGLAYSPSSAYEEIVGLDRSREDRRINRGNYGAGIAQLGQNYYSQGLASLLGITPSGGHFQMPDVGFGSGDLASIGINDTMARRNDKAARRANQTALQAAGIEAVGSIAGGFAGG